MFQIQPIRCNCIPKIRNINREVIELEYATQDIALQFPQGHAVPSKTLYNLRRKGRGVLTCTSCQDILIISFGPNKTLVEIAPVITKCISRRVRKHLRQLPVYYNPKKDVSNNSYVYKMIGTDEIIVTLASQADDASTLDFICAKYGLSLEPIKLSLENSYLLKYYHNDNKPPFKTLEISIEIGSLAGVEYSSPNFAIEYHVLNESQRVIHGEEVSEQFNWHLEQLGVTEACRANGNRKPSTIAVMDDGIWSRHPMLTSSLLPGKNYCDNHDNTDPDRGMSHGTKCAGLCLSATGNKCRLLPIKVLRKKQGYEMLHNLADAVAYAGHQADILCCSFRIDHIFEHVHRAFVDVATKGRNGLGCLIFASSGNEGTGTLTYPGSHESCIAVGACTADGKRWPLSNYGEGLAFVAPSGAASCKLNSTNFPTKQSKQLTTDDCEGTSYANALAAGIGAFLLSVKPQLSRSEAFEILRKGAKKLSYKNIKDDWNDEVGYGLINALCVSAPPKKV